MRSFISQVNDKIIRKVDYKLSRQYGVIYKTSFIDISANDSVQEQVNNESVNDFIGDRHEIYGARLFKDNFSTSFKVYTECLLYRITFQILSPFSANAKLGIFNEKSTVGIIDLCTIDNGTKTALPEGEYELNIWYDTDVFNSLCPAELNQEREYFKIHTIPFGTTSINELPVASEEEFGKVYQYTGATTASLTSGYIYKCVQVTSSTYAWKALFAMKDGYEFYAYTDSAENGSPIYRLMPRVINVDPYETEDKVPVPIDVNVHVTGNSEESAFAFITLETYPIAFAGIDTKRIES